MFATLTFAVWAYLNRPTSEPPWPAVIQGFCFSPYRADQDATNGDFPTREQIASDLDLLKGKTQAVRTYTVEGTIGLVPELAAERGLNVALGVWIDARREHNEQELKQAIELARKHRNIVRVIVGNESVLFGYLPFGEFVQLLDRARAAIEQPISTAEPWHVWLKNPELVEHVDFITVHLLPYWEGVAVDKAVGYSIDRFHALQARFPTQTDRHRRDRLADEGRTRETAVASEAGEALFLRRFLACAEKEHVPYYIMEAFDQPWKGKTEGAVGAYWGVYDANRHPKFEFTKPIVRTPQWELLAAVSVVLAAIMLFWFYMYSGTLKNRGRSFLAVIIYATSALATWVIYDYSQQYLTVTSVAVGVLLFIGMIGVIAGAARRSARMGRSALGAAAPPSAVGPAAEGSDGAYRPKVSIHVPAYNEPPDMVIETLDALAVLDYPDFEVLVIDNNTTDEAVWRPVEAQCARLGPRFRFFHVAPLAGFKAGALNFALGAHRARGRDRRGDRQRLRGGPATGCAICADFQRPEDRDRAGAAGLPRRRAKRLQGNVPRRVPGLLSHRHDHAQRAQRHHPARHHDDGPARACSPTCGGWAEWCITEDAELGLRVFEAWLRGDLYPAQLRQRADAGHLHRLQEAALPLGVRRHADPARPRGAAVRQAPLR